jgi:hypothetical protein
MNFREIDILYAKSRSNEDRTTLLSDERFLCFIESLKENLTQNDPQTIALITRTLRNACVYAPNAHFLKQKGIIDLYFELLHNFCVHNILQIETSDVACSNEFDHIPAMIRSCCQFLANFTASSAENSAYIWSTKLGSNRIQDVIACAKRIRCDEALGCSYAMIYNSIRKNYDIVTKLCFDRPLMCQILLACVDISISSHDTNIHLKLSSIANNSAMEWMLLLISYIMEQGMITSVMLGIKADLPLSPEQVSAMNDI